MKKTTAISRKSPAFASTMPAFSPEARAIVKVMLETKEGSLKLLQGAGILDKHGKHTKPYRDAS